MSKPISLNKDSFALSSNANQQAYPFSKGQRIKYEGEEDEIIRVNL